MKDTAALTRKQSCISRTDCKPFAGNSTVLLLDRAVPFGTNERHDFSLSEETNEDVSSSVRSRDYAVN